MDIKKIDEAIENLRNVLIEELSEHTVSAEVFINASECKFSYNVRTPDMLAAQGVSMRNLAGDFIK